MLAVGLRCCAKLFGTGKPRLVEYIPGMIRLRQMLVLSLLVSMVRILPALGGDQGSAGYRQCVVTNASFDGNLGTWVVQLEQKMRVQHPSVPFDLTLDLGLPTLDNHSQASEEVLQTLRTNFTAKLMACLDEEKVGWSMTTTNTGMRCEQILNYIHKFFKCEVTLKDEGAVIRAFPRHLEIRMYGMHTGLGPCEGNPMEGSVSAYNNWYTWLVMPHPSVRWVYYVIAPAERHRQVLKEEAFAVWETNLVTGAAKSQ